MAFVRLRRHAPEAQSADTCSVCGAHSPSETNDHMVVGPPGTPIFDGAVCESCGTTLDNVAQKVGTTLTLNVEEAQREPTDRDTPLAHQPQAAQESDAGHDRERGHSH